MPSQIKSVINKTINNFIWDDRKGVRIALEQLQQPKDSRGLNILNIQAHDKAINVTIHPTFFLVHTPLIP